VWGKVEVWRIGGPLSAMRAIAKQCRVISWEATGRVMDD
jgi:hypothetical protein